MNIFDKYIGISYLLMYLIFDDNCTFYFIFQLEREISNTLINFTLSILLVNK